MTNVSDMVNNFLQAEEKNFSLFNFVNDLNRCTAVVVLCCSTYRLGISVEKITILSLDR